MPYIDPDDQARVSERREPRNAGELNYLITTTVDAYLNDPEIETVRYARLNEVIGVLECAKLELYRRVVAQYENKKIAKLGDDHDVYAVLKRPEMQ